MKNPLKASAHGSLRRAADVGNSTSHLLRAVIAAAWTQGQRIDTKHCIYAEDGRQGHMPYYSLLAGMSALLQARTILEIGTFRGGSALSLEAGLAAGVQEGIVITLDVSQDTCPSLEGYPRIKRVVAEFPTPLSIDLVDSVLAGNFVDLLYIDALKSGEFLASAVLAGLRWNPMLVICDDVMANNSIQQAWEELSADPRFLCAQRCCQSIQGIRSNIYDMGFLLCDRANPALLSQRAEVVSVTSFNSAALRPSEEIPSSLQCRELPGMINDNERQLYYHIVTHRLSGAGQIVDAGACLGASSRIFGEGLRAKGAASDIRVHSYDLFRNTNTSHDKFLQPPPSRNSDLLPYFMRNVCPVADRINIYPGNFLDMKWTGSPIELCFVDIAKSPALNAHVYASFASAWIPGHTYYLQQDFVHLEAPWVQYVIGYLADHFVFLRVEAPTLCMGVTSPIPIQKIDRITADDFTPDEKAHYALSLAKFFSDSETLCAIKLIGARLLAEAGKGEDAAELVAALECDKSVAALANNRRRLKRTKDLIQSLAERDTSDCGCP